MLLNSESGLFFNQLTILLIIFSAIIVVSGRKTEANADQANRIARGLYLLLFFRLTLSFLALLIASGGGDPTSFTWLDRGLTTAAWIVIIWLWLFPNPGRSSDTGAGLMTILAISLTFLTVGLISRQPALSAWLAPAWSIYAMLVLGIGAILLANLKPELWGYALSMLLILIMAEAGELALLLLSGSNATLIRLAAIAGYPILLTLPQRLPAEKIIVQEAQQITRRVPERKRVNLPPGVYGKFLSLATETDLLKLSRGITETVSFAMVADICLLVSRPTAQDEIIIYCGYDQVLEQDITGAQIASRHLPMIASAIQKHSPLRLPASSASSDLKFLSSALHLPKSGHLLVAPIRTASDIGVGALILLTPYSSRTWTQDDQTYLSQAAEKVGTLLERSQSAQGMMQEIEDLRSKLTEADVMRASGSAGGLAKFGRADGLETPLENAELLNALEEAARRQQELETEIHALQESNQRMQTDFADENWEQTVQHLQAENIQLQLTVQELETQQEEIAARMENFKAAHKESLQLVEQLYQENEKLRTDLENRKEGTGPFSSTNGKPGSRSQHHTEDELKEALREIAHLRNLLGESEIKILELENLSSSTSNTTHQWETIITLAEEMRQPMSSILGYSDFLLTESVGLLGTMQRKFLERVKASTSRMGAMIEDLIHIAASESGKLKLNFGLVDLTSVIDSTIASSTVQMREKTITLLVNLPDDLPTIEGDREAIRLTLIHLLHNATAATPALGKITIAIELEETADELTYINISISDSGGGIAPANLPKVFDRRFQSKDELLPGLGVSSSGLSIAKSLVEAHGGRIWVENNDADGAVFCIVLPMKQAVSSSIFDKRSN